MHGGVGVLPVVKVSAGVIPDHDLDFDGDEG